MLVTVLKSFLYAHDGFTIRELVPSDEDPPAQVEVRDELVAGLVGVGYVAAPEVKVVDLFNGADPALFDHDGDGKPGGSLKLDGLAAIAEVDFDRIPVSDSEILTGEGVAAPLGVLTGDGTGEILPPIETNGGEQTALAAFNADTADEDALRAFLTARDGKEPDKRFGPDRLRALAKTAPAAEGASE